MKIVDHIVVHMKLAITDMFKPVRMACGQVRVLVIDRLRVSGRPQPKRAKKTAYCQRSQREKGR